MSDSLQPHGLQHTRLSCPSPTPKACSHSCPSGQWFHPSISSSVVSFSSCLQSFLESGSFQMSWFFTLSGQSINFSFSSSPSDEYSGLISIRKSMISLQSNGLSRLFTNTTVQKYQFFGTQHFLWSNSHIHTWLLEENHTFDYMNLCQ